MSPSYDQFFKKVKQNTSQQTGKKPVDVSALAKQMKKTKTETKLKNKKFPATQFFLFLLFSGGFFLAVENFDHIETYVKKIEIGLGEAQASSRGEAQASEKVTEPKVPAATEEKIAEAKPESKSVDESDFLFKLAERKKELDQREEDLNKKSAEIEKQKKDIESKLVQLEDYRTKISTLLKERITVDSSKVDTLVQVYSNMKPIQAAQVFEKMDEDLVIEILSRMKKKSAADILNLIKTEKAQVFAEKYAGYRMPALAAESNNSNNKMNESKP
jgi:flagellar motility protein MotE (MotC chaperone)